MSKAKSPVTHWSKMRPDLAEKAIAMRMAGAAASKILRELQIPSERKPFHQWLQRNTGHIPRQRPLLWNNARDAMLRDLYEAGEYRKVIAAKLGVGEDSLTKRISKLGLKRPHRIPMAQRPGAVARAKPQRLTTLGGRRNGTWTADPIAIPNSERERQERECQRHLEAIEREGVGCFPFHCEGEPRLVSARIGSRTVRANHYPLEEVTW